jgi:broad specificity phosphatase PhoE
MIKQANGTDAANNPEKLETPTKKLRRRQDGSPVLALDTSLPTKTIYLIRHGHSQGQAAQRNGLDRKKDPRLRDCGLAPKGLSEALGIPKFFTSEELDSIQLVLSSPLTRALHTALLAFPSNDVLVHFDLREVGSNVPENVPRRMKEVLKDLELYVSERDESLLLDVNSLQPADWPRDYSPSVIKRDRIRRVFQWLYKERPESTIAVVCHYNVIRSAVIDGEKLRPRNATPIRCSLYSNGELVVSEA